jgi:hypothetical protein
VAEVSTLQETRLRAWVHDRICRYDEQINGTDFNKNVLRCYAHVIGELGKELMNFSLKFAALLAEGVCCANASFKADAPKDYKDEARYGFGSLLRGENSVIRKYLNRKPSSADEDSKDTQIEGTKLDTEPSPRDDIWTAAQNELKGFPFELLDKKSWKIETETVKISKFDETGRCSYKITIVILSDTEFSVSVQSAQDSKQRLRCHGEVLKENILKRIADAKKKKTAEREAIG